MNGWQPERRNHTYAGSSRGCVSSTILTKAIAAAAAAAGYLSSKVPARPVWALDKQLPQRTSPNPINSPLQHDHNAPIKTWSRFLHLLSLGWPYYFSQQVAVQAICADSDSRPGDFLHASFWNPAELPCE